MKIGLEFAEYGWAAGSAGAGRTLGEVVRVADDAGFDLIGVGDHLWQGPHAGGPEKPLLECFTTLAFIAAHTERCRIAPVVAGVHLRHPSVLAKTVTTLDVLSGGRAMLGLGAGWYADEAEGMGFAFPSTAQRFGMVEEALQICLRLWEGEAGDDRPFTGEHYQLKRPLSLPRSVSRPHPPIVVGGDGRRALRLVARYGDACNIYPGHELEAKLELLRGFCAEEGRAYDEIEKTAIFPFAVDARGNGAAEQIEQLHQWAEAGIETAIGIVEDADPLRQVMAVAEKVLPAVAGF